jgi:hypothetical protein
MVYREINTVCSQILTEHINTQCGQNLELLNVKLAVHAHALGFKGLLVSRQGAMRLTQLTLHVTRLCSRWFVKTSLRF